MMRKAITLATLAGALALGGCVSKERVTLLSPSQPGKDIGGVVIDYEDGRQAFLGEFSQQAKLRGQKVPHLVRQFDKADPFYSDLAEGLPPMVVRDYFYFALGKDELPASEVERLQDFIAQNIVDRPGFQIEIAAHTDVSGGLDINTPLSELRAKNVVEQVKAKIKESNIDISDDDIEDLAGSQYWAQQVKDSGQPYVARDFRVAVVTIR